jgi:hypothetical protein
MNTLARRTARNVSNTPVAAMRSLATIDGQEQVGIVVLADISGSMCGTRIERLRTELGLLWEEIGHSARLFEFNESISPVESPAHLTYPRGGTNLAGAIRTANALFPSILFIISDGQPNDPRAALLEAESTMGEIHGQTRHHRRGSDDEEGPGQRSVDPRRHANHARPRSTEVTRRLTYAGGPGVPDRPTYPGTRHQPQRRKTDGHQSNQGRRPTTSRIAGRAVDREHHLRGMG